MSDQEFREIQLTAKQLFFLFMSAVVVAVVIFLLGVSVGRGVQGEAVSAAADTGTVSDTVVTASTPPASTPAAGQTPNLTYDPKLQGGPVPPPSAQPAAPPSAETAKPADATTAPATTPAPEKPAVAPDRTAAALPPSTSKPASGAGEVPPIRPEPKPAAPAPSGLALQVGAFSSRENAETLVATLKSKGYPAFMVAVPQAKASFAVRVGPFAGRAEADKASARLAREEGYKPFVIAR